MMINAVDPALIPANVLLRPKEERFRDDVRRWQGIPCIEVTKKGRIFVGFYGGQNAETPDNAVIVCISDDRGGSFRSCEIVVEHPHPEIRPYDPCLWIDPLGRLWLCWNQTRHFNDGRIGVWTAICDDPDADQLRFSAPRRIANGLMPNKPIATGNGDWLFPCAIWRDGCGAPPTERHGLENEQFSNVYASGDQGRTIALRGSADVPMRAFDEHMVVEKRDGSLWMLVRTFDGLGESFSTDGGRTWSAGRKSHIDGPCSRFHISRLKSGRLLLVNHYQFEGRIDLNDIMTQGDVKSWKGRNHLTALLSEDDGATWPYSLLLDVRNDAAYPDAKEGEDGYIYIAYDWERVTQREILMARITEQDILDGRIASADGKLKILVNKCTGQPDIH